MSSLFIILGLIAIMVGAFWIHPGLALIAGGMVFIRSATVSIEIVEGSEQ